MAVIQAMSGGSHGFVKMKKARVSSALAAETETGIVLPTKCMVLDAFIDVITVDTGETVDIGTSGDASDDPDGFCDGLLLTTAGIIQGSAVVTTGGNETYFSSNTRGVLLSDFLAGSNVATDVGTYREKSDATSGGEAVTYTASAAGAAFDVYVIYIEL
jgi:hypothetical protein